MLLLWPFCSLLLELERRTRCEECFQVGVSGSGVAVVVGAGPGKGTTRAGRICTLFQRLDIVGCVHASLRACRIEARQEETSSLGFALITKLPCRARSAFLEAYFELHTPVPVVTYSSAHTKYVFCSTNTTVRRKMYSGSCPTSTIKHLSQH